MARSVWLAVAEIGTGQSLMTVTLILAAPLAGKLIDRYGLRSVSTLYFQRFWVVGGEQNDRRAMVILCLGRVLYSCWRENDPLSFT